MNRRGKLDAYVPNILSSLFFIFPLLILTGRRLLWSTEASSWSPCCIDGKTNIFPTSFFFISLEVAQANVEALHSSCSKWDPVSIKTLHGNHFRLFALPSQHAALIRSCFPFFLLCGGVISENKRLLVRVTSPKPSVNTLRWKTVALNSRGSRHTRHYRFYRKHICKY